MSVGVHQVTVSPDPTGGGGAPVDITCLLDELTIQHGRDDTDTQPEASAATLNLDLAGETLPAAVDIGARVTVTTTVGGTVSTRFVGRITDVALGWDEAGEQTPETGVGQIIAVGPLADLGRRVVGDAPFPQELDGARVSRVLGLAGVVTNPATSDPGTLQVNPRDVDAQAALDVAQGTATSAGGLVWQTRDGDVRYSDNVHRRRLPSVLALDACDILVTPTWARTLEGIINKVTISYGVGAGGGEQPTVAMSNDVSIARYGTYDFSLTSELATFADAQSMAGLLLARNSSPIWMMPALPLDLAHLDDADTLTVLGLEMHNLLTLTGLPALGSAPTSANLWVEGWSERLAFGEHDIELNVSGYCRTAPAPWWDDTDPSVTWDNVGTLSWDDAACLGPPLPGDKWNDVPASTRWDDVPAAVTWDTYQPISTREAA
jgi:hypothetical protein